MYILLAALIIILIFLLAEKFLTNYHTQRIKIRILVTGSRGKSTVTQYIASIFNEAGYKSVCKITGVIPTISFPNGSSKVIKRTGPARVTEQFRTIKNTSKYGADVLVLECMSINPELQKVEAMVFKPHFIVLTNIREDHMEEIGADERVRIEKVCSAFPNKSKLVLPKSTRSTTLEKYCSKNDIEVIDANDLGLEWPGKINDDSYSENYWLAKKVTSYFNVSDQHCIDGIAKVEQDLLRTKHELNIGKHNIIFYNLFALNDVNSADLFITQLDAKYLSGRDLIIILNTRQDRPLRSISFAKWISKLPDVKKIIVVGNHSNRTLIELRKNQVSPDKIICWKEKELKKAKENLGLIITQDSLLLGIGNIANDGFKIINSLTQDN